MSPRTYHWTQPEGSNTSTARLEKTSTLGNGITAIRSEALALFPSKLLSKLLLTSATGELSTYQ